MKQKNDHIKLLKKRSEQPRWKKALRFLFRLTLLAAIFLLISHAETYFRINEIEVKGAGEISAEEIIFAGQVSKGKSIIFLREEKIAERIKNEYPVVKSVEINRVLPDKISLVIDERSPVGFIITADGFWFMDSSTVPFAYQSEKPDGYPLIKGIEGKLVIPGFPLDCQVRRKTLSNFFSAWSEKRIFEIEKLDITESYNLVVYTAEELEIWLGDSRKMENKLELVELSMPYLAENSKVRLDVRSGNRLVLSSSVMTDQKEVDP